MTLRSLLLAVVVLTAALSQSVPPSQAQATWPQRTVKFIVPLGPGSGVDTTARLLASQLSARWGKPVVVENRPGGDGFVAIGAFVGARDDHTFLFAPTSAFTAHPFLHDKLPYDPRDLMPIARVTSTLAGVGVSASLKIESLAELVALARAEPGKLNWAGITGALDLSFAGFLKSANLNINKVPYRDGVQAAERSRRRPHPGLPDRTGGHPAADRSRESKADCDGQPGARSLGARRSDRHRSRLPEPDVRRARRPVRAARCDGGPSQPDRRRCSSGCERPRRCEAVGSE